MKKNILTVSLIDKYFSKKAAAEKANAALKAVEDEIRTKMAEAGIEKYEGLGYTIDLSPVWKNVFQPTAFRNSSPENAALYEKFSVNKPTARPFKIAVKK
jgi:hypothetical protein